MRRLTTGVQHRLLEDMVVSGSLKEISIKRSDVFWINPTELQVKPEWNSRVFNDPENKAHIASLKTSIRAVGVLEPLTVFREQEKIYISDGHCRLAAVLELLSEGIQIASVPVKTEGKGTNEADALLRQALDGKPKTAFELGHIFKRLLAYGWSEEDIATKSGKGIQSVRMSLELQSAPIAVQKMVASGRVSPTLAVQTLAKEGDKAVETLGAAIDTAAQQGKTRATAQHVGLTPHEPRKSRMVQVQEIIAAIKPVEDHEDLEEADFTNKIALLITRNQYASLQTLLDF